MTRTLQEIDRIIARSFAYDDLRTEPTEKEYWEMAGNMGWDYGNGNCYDGTPPRLTDEQRERLRQMYNPKRDYDDLDVKLGLVRGEQLDPIVLWIARPVEDCETVEFNWKWQTTTNAGTQHGRRDRLRFGKLRTRTQTLVICGFESWQEFNAHCHLNDKQLALDYHRVVQDTIAENTKITGEYAVCYWLVKDENLTRPGFWAITIDRASDGVPDRNAVIFANNTITYKENVVGVKGSTFKLENNNG